jgi:thiamine transport system substrate-binding protein
MSPLITLIVYAYSSLAAEWGAGPIIAREFQKNCHCQVKFIDTGDGKDVVGRLKLEGEKTPADVILGVDLTSVDILKKDLHWDVTAQAFDYSPYAFVYNSKLVKDPPKSLDDLLSPTWKGEIIIQDPRLSSPGLGFLLWIIAEKGEVGAWSYLKRLKPQLKMISPSWDLAYGLFKKGQAKIVFSYWTSPAYHIQEEKNFDYKAAAFDNGNYIQKEYVVLTPRKNKDKLKKEFVDFLLSEFSQKEMAKDNFMYPINPKTPLPQSFQKIGKVKELPELSPTPSQIETWLKKWREIFS